MGELKKSAILSWSIITPSTVKGDPYAIFKCTYVVCIADFKLLSMFWYVEYLAREMTAPESMRALQHFPEWTVIVGQSMMSAIIICLFEDGPLHSWESLLGEDYTSLKTLILLQSQWNYPLNCNNLMDVLLCGPSYSF